MSRAMAASMPAVAATAMLQASPHRQWAASIQGADCNGEPLGGEVMAAGV
ncbi:hypothetical protein [Candidatus Dactylopiibacterium carminicum]|nr:hypothetical protein [Candidatus Dactylopiibacterium carminicum]